MSYLTFDNNGVIFHDAADKPQRLIDFLNTAENRSDLAQADLVNGVQSDMKRLFDNTAEGMIRLIIFLRIAARLIRKPQKHQVLHAGQWSTLDEVLASFLPKFNAQNYLWSYSPTRPVGKFSHVNFVFAEVDGGDYIPNDAFASIICSEQKLPSTEMFLAAENFGMVYFLAPKPSLPDYLKPHVRTFDPDKNFSIVEAEVSPTLKQELIRRSPRGQLEDKKNSIRRTISKVQEVAKKFNELPPQDRNRHLDEYIAELTRAERLLNEIYPQLHSDTIKVNFNMFKEFLIDFRLYEDWQLKKHAAEDLSRQIQILAQDLNSL